MDAALEVRDPGLGGKGLDVPLEHGDVVADRVDEDRVTLRVYEKLVEPTARVHHSPLSNNESMAAAARFATFQEELRLAIGAAHKTTRAATDLRALLSAYAHKFHNPRPVISDLARAQDTSSQGFIRRYSEGTVDAVASLLSSKPDVEAVLLAFPSVSILDLVDLGGTVGAAAQALLDSGRYDTKGVRARKLRVSSADEDNAARRARAGRTEDV